MLSHTRTFLRLLGHLVLVIYFIVALGVLGIRYWLLPNIDQFRPYVEQQLSAALGMPVGFSQIDAEWSGLNPSLTLTDVSLRDTQGDTVFAVPSVRARFSWRSLLTWQLHFDDLEASGIDLTVRKDANRHLHLLGQALDMDAVETETGLSADVIAWLGLQPRIVLRDAVIRWVDETRDARPFVLRQVTLNLQNEGINHRFSLKALPPAPLGQAVEIRGDFQRLSPDAAGLLALEHGLGQLYFQVDGMRPQGWDAWVDMPSFLQAGTMSAKLWLQLSQGAINHVTADFTVHDGYWLVGDATHINAGYSHIYLDGPVAAFRSYADYALLNSDAPGAPLASSLSYRLDAARLSLEDTTQFAAPLVIDAVAAQGHLGYDRAGLNVGVERLNVRNPDIDARLQGEWQQDGTTAGKLRLHGLIQRASIAAIVNYLPKDVDPPTREWLAHGLAEGEIYDATVVLDGPLADFPFAGDEQQGDFSITGRYRNAVIDYLPTEGKVLGWPAVRDMQGTVAMRRAGLFVHVDSAKLLPDGKQPVHLKNVSAQIPDMAGIAILKIDGPTQGDAAAYMELMRHSALGPLLDGLFDQATATGVWQVPLSLTIPLSTDDNPQVQGHIQFNGGDVRLMPQLPPLQKLQGTLNFSDQKVSASGLTARFFGSAAAISGELGGKSKGLVMQGRSATSPWAEYIKVKGMERIKGEMAYRFQVQQSSGGQLSMRLTSDLKGVELAFPEPLAKSASAAMPLVVLWQGAKDGKNLELDIQLGSDINSRFLHKLGSQQGPYFYAGAVGVKQQPSVLPVGTNLDIQALNFDADVWKNVVQEFSEPAKKAGAAADRVIFPDVQKLRLQAKHGRLVGLDMSELTYTANKPEAGQWRVDISSSETAGTLLWREEKGKVVGAVEANFHRLSLGSDKPDSAPDPVSPDTDPVLKIEDDLSLPGINMKVKNLYLYGRDAGELSLVGVNQAHGQSWLLKKINLHSPYATLTGTGVWQLKGKGRGLTLNAAVEFKDVGAYFDQLGFTEIMDAGHGTAKGTLEWRNMPWGFSKADLNGSIALELDQGRFTSMGSHSARLLELLSFQSFSRMSRLDLNPGSLTKNGFPYDSLRGTLVLDQGIARTNDYRVIGPVGTIMLDGQTNLMNETLDAQAVVIPNLDVSGAAIAAGFAINPIVGVGTFLTQWLLKEPLAKAMTAHYHIGGSWDEPKVTENGKQP